MITDPNGALTSWNSSLHFCDWDGVTCGKRHRRVTSLRLRSIGLAGSLSPHVGNLSFLRRLSLPNNTFKGAIPHEIGHLSRLRILALEINKFDGVIPANLSGCPNLEVLDLSDNELVGSIPKDIHFLLKLNFFSLQFNKLTGGIPPFLGNITSMESFSVRGNLPPTIGAMFPHLVLLEIWGNHLTGPLPSSISNCSRLADLEVARNMFSGKLTIDFSQLSDIYFISLYNNLFGSKEVDEMKFIDSLENCTRLETLDISYCNFQGVLPKSIDRNHFTGSIPSTISNLQQLQAIYLYQNQLSGQIPDTMGNLSLLITLSLFSNKLEGVIPSSLGYCHSLLELYLNDNKLTGKIPTQIFQLSSLSIKLDLSQNNLFGLIPYEVGDLKMLGELDLSENRLSGNIPSSLSGCASLSSLLLRGNLFQGMIPPSLSSLKALVELDISHNNLSGQIPKFLERLKYLNMSYNDFEGEVPTSGVFANATTFSVLGNNRLCGGFVELGLPKCKGKKQHRKHIPLIVIAILIASTLLSIICLAFAWCKKKSKNQMSQPSMSERWFSEANLIGNGGFSSVYKGVLDEYDGRFVAIKVIHVQNLRAERSFIRECEALRNIRHRNLLRIITTCSSIDFQGNDFKALVYEFMPNGSLHDWLHPTMRLSLLQIINILMDVACALDYIHNHCIPSVVHGDLKPRNILLDDDMVAHVGDFGLSRLLGTNSYQNSSTEIKGTIGYAAPEYGVGNEMTVGGDVMTGKAPTDNLFNEDLSLHKFASNALQDQATNVIDVNILNVYEEDTTFMQNKETNVKIIEECLASTIKIGVSCTVDSPLQRMDIKKIRFKIFEVF
ncbi:hypothetical protein M8C21_024796, partial [Ambrosia artemisiifolia]